jgi:protein-tyrosine phosphatase
MAQFANRRSALANRRSHVTDRRSAANDRRSHSARALSSAPNSFTQGATFAALRTIGWTLRHLPDRLFHPLRRRRAIVRLGRQRPASLLLVCHGNVMRSPYAEAVLRRLLGARSRVRVASAGFIGSDRATHPVALEGAASRGVDLGSHRSRLVSPVILRDADLVVVMDNHQRRALCKRFGVGGQSVVVLGDLDPWPVATRAIEDPYNRPRAVLDVVYARIDRCLATLAPALGRAVTADMRPKPTRLSSDSL